MKKILSIGGLGLLMMGCSGQFLNVTPESTITSATFYQTEDQFQQAVVSTYAATRDVFGGIQSWTMGEMRSDNTHYDYNQSDRGTQYEAREQIADFTDDALNQYSNEKYYQCYTGISRANTILSRLDGSSLKAETKNAIAGETKFLRALYYFELVQYYGAVPLYTKEIVKADESYLSRSPVEDVYKLILADAQEAAQKLPAPVFPQTGRATSATANMLLAKIYMVRKDYPAAQKALEAVTKAGYSLLPDYAAVFSPANKSSQESIFEVQYQQGNQGQQSQFIYYFIPNTLNAKLITGIATSDLGGNWNVPSQDILKTYEAGDKRFDASIGLVEGTGDASSFTYTAVVSPVNYVAKPGVTAKPFIKKYQHPHSLAFNTDDNWPIYRYADALLLLAEAYNEQGQSASALPLLNQVRSRAGLSAVAETNQAKLRDVIAHERRVELAFENWRWLDLVRTGKAIDVLTRYGQQQKALYPYLQPRTYNVTQDRLLFPIPNRELQINTQLTQNSGY